MDRAIKLLERVVVLSPIAMMALIILLSTVELGWIILKDIFTAPYVLPGIGVSGCLWFLPPDPDRRRVAGDDPRLPG